MLCIFEHILYLILSGQIKFFDIPKRKIKSKKLQVLNWKSQRKTKEYGIEGRYKWRGPPYHIIIHALQTVLHLNEKYLSDVTSTAYTLTYSEYFLFKCISFLFRTTPFSQVKAVCLLVFLVVIGHFLGHPQFNVTTRTF